MDRTSGPHAGLEVTGATSASPSVGSDVADQRRRYEPLTLKCRSVTPTRRTETLCSGFRRSALQDWVVRIPGGVPGLLVFARKGGLAPIRRDRGDAAVRSLLARGTRTYPTRVSLSLQRSKRLDTSDDTSKRRRAHREICGAR